MKKQAAPVQYTIRGISPEVDRALRAKAKQLKQSLNRLVLDELTAAAVGRKKRADLSDVVGRWTPDASFDEILAAQRQIDAEKWS